MPIDALSHAQARWQRHTCWRESQQGGAGIDAGLGQGYFRVGRGLRLMAGSSMQGLPRDVFIDFMTLLFQPPDRTSRL